MYTPNPEVGLAMQAGLIKTLQQQVEQLRAELATIKQQCDELMAAAEHALKTLEMERILSADNEGNYTVEVTPKRTLNSINKLSAALAKVK